MRIVEGDRFKHKCSGQLYEVKIIKEDTFILKSADSPYRMWFGEGDLELYFEMVGRRKRNFKEVKQIH
jgi:hypothetical protein